MPATKFADLPIVNEPWGDKLRNENAILGDPPDWDRFKRAHLWWNPDAADSKAGYKLIVAKMIDGRLKAVRSQVSAAIAAINGGRGKPDIPANELKAAYDSAVRYLKKFDPEIEPPAFQGEQQMNAMRMILAQVKLQGPAEGADPSQPVWQHVASEGKFDGYRGGEVSFTFDERIFQQIVRNFRRHPAFKAGAEGYGVEDVIAWDFHHASEQPPAEGAIPFTGAPAQGWVLDLEVRFDSEGKAELWALTRWLEPARTYIQTERYRWASVSVVFDAVDPKSGENIGAVLTSIALTNAPFIEGMTPLAASKRAAAASLRRYFDVAFIDPAHSPEDALNSIREMLQLPETADAAAVVGELNKLKAWVSTGTAPLGVDIDTMLGGLRRILNLPALASPEEVFAEVDKLTARLTEGSGVSEDQSAPPQASPGGPATPPPTAPAPMERRNMDLLKVIAEALGVVADAETVKDSIADLVKLRNAAANAVGLEQTAATKVVLKATVDNEGVRSKYRAILGALGVEDPDAAMDKIADLITQSEDLKKAAPELAALRKAQAQAEEEEIEEDVEEAMASRGWSDEGLKIALTHLRRNDAATFAAKYPKQPKPPAAAAHLTQKIVPQGQPTGDKIDLSRFEGRNVVERAINFIKATDKDAASMDWEQLNERAWMLVRSIQKTA